MKKIKILIVSRSFFPQNSPRSFRTTQLAKEFARQGHEVTVITPKVEEHFAFEKEHKLEIKDLGKPSWQAVKLGGGGASLFAKRAIRRFSKLWFEYPEVQLVKLVSDALKNERDYDLMISIAVPFAVHWGVAKTRSKNHPIAKTWVADCGDPFMGQENDTFKLPFYFKYVEKWFSRKADYLTVPTQGAIQAYYPEFHYKIKVIPQGFSFDEIKLYEGEPDNKMPTFAYAGALTPHRRDPSELLEYLTSKDLDFRFHVFTKNTSLVEKHVKKSNGRIILENTIPREELLYKMSKMDFVVNFENMGTKQTPSKLIDYAIIDKPVLSVKTGELDTNAVDNFLERKYSSRLIIEDPEKYRIENVTKKFLDLIYL